MNARGRIDWEALKSRLQALDTPSTDQEQIQQIYRQRAAALAARTAGGPATSVAGSSAVPSPAGRLVLAFTLGDERYGLDLSALAGVLPFARCTPVPKGPAELLGVINHRGQVCSVLDLSRLLGVWTKPTSTAYILLLRRPGREIGLKVDHVEAVVRLDPATSIAGCSHGDELGTVATFLEGLSRDQLRLLRTSAILGHPLLMERSRE